MFQFIDITVLIVILTFIRGIYEYIKSIKWKKSEFLSKEVKEFFKDEDVIKVKAMLDWDVRYLEINGKEFKVTNDFLISALQTHNNKNKFTQEEAAIRDIFDNFFDKISYFSIYIDNKLVDKKEVKKYLSYYIDIISKPGRKPKKLVDTFNDYINYYNFNQVRDLINHIK
jgi:hypothetical protein